MFHTHRHTPTNHAVSGNPNCLWKNNAEGCLWLFAMSPQANGSDLALPSMKVSGGKSLPALFRFGDAATSIGAFLGTVGCQWEGTKSWQDLGMGTGELSTL